jgi:hypothetical protein
VIGSALWLWCDLLQVGAGPATPVTASSDLSWIWGVAVAPVAVIWGVWRDLDARKARRDNESLRRRLDLRPLVELVGWAEWDPQDTTRLIVHADFTNHGPGAVRDVRSHCQRGFAFFTTTYSIGCNPQCHLSATGCNTGRIRIGSNPIGAMSRM